MTDSSEGPVLDESFLSSLMRQSMSLDLSKLMEEFTFEVESSLVSVGSVVSVTAKLHGQLLEKLGLP